MILFRRWPEGLQFPAVNFGIDQGGAFAKYGETQIGRLRQSRQCFQGKIANTRLSAHQERLRDFDSIPERA